MSRDWLDRSLDPLWVQTFPATFTQAELDAAFDHLDACVSEAVKEKAPKRMLTDFSRARVGGARMRKRVAETFLRTQRIARHLVTAQAFVVANPVQRGALTATFWLVSPGWPIAVFTTRHEALAWLDQR